MEHIYYDQIKEALIRELKDIYPDWDIFGEEIARTAAGDYELGVQNYAFITLTPIRLQTVGRYMSVVSVLVDITLHTEAETNAEYLRIAIEVDQQLRPTLRIGDTIAATIQEARSLIVDKSLHYTFTLRFRVMRERPDDPSMETLMLQNIKVKG